MRSLAPRWSRAFEPLQRSDRVLPWLLPPVVLLALALRLHALVTPQRGIWIDEAFSIWVARHPLPRLVGILQTVDTHPPLFYVLLHFWVLLGDGPFWVRLFPAITATLTVGAGYLLGSILAGRRTGLITAVLFAVSPVLVQYGQEDRMYALVVLLSVLSLWSLLWALKRGGRWRWAVFAIVTTALLYSYTETFFLPVAEGLYLLIFARRRDQLLPGLAAFAVVAACWLLWLPSALHQFGGISHRFWIPPPDIPRVVNTMLTLVDDVDLPTLAAGYGAGPFSRLGAWLLLPVALLALAGFVRLPAMAAAERREAPDGASAHRPPGPSADRRYAAGNGRWLVLAAFLVPQLGALAASRISPVYLDRSLLYSLAGLLPLVAAGLAALPAPGLLVPGVAIWCCFQFSGLDHYYRFATKEDWQGLTQRVAASAQPGELVLFSGSWLQLAFDYYYHGPPLRERGLPVDLFARGALESPMVPDDVARLPALVGQDRQVWLVYGHEGFDDPQGLVLPALQPLFQRRTRTVFAGPIELYHFTDPTGGTPQIALDDRFQQVARLRGLSLQPASGKLTVTLYWQVLGRSPSNLHVFVHLLRPDGTVLAQHDGEPLSGTQHTSLWAPCARLADPHPIALSQGLPTPLRLEIGLYDLPSGRRVPVSGPQASGGDHVLVIVRNPGATPSAAP